MVPASKLAVSSASSAVAVPARVASTTVVMAAKKPLKKKVVKKAVKKPVKKVRADPSCFRTPGSLSSLEEAPFRAPFPITSL